MNNKEQKVEQTSENGNITKLHVMGSGYLCSIDGKKLFVVAVNIADCMEQLEIMADGKKYQMETHSSVPICHCP